MRSTWEARQSGRPGAEAHGKIHGGRAMPEAVLYSTGKPDHAGGPPRGSTYTCKAVSAGGLVVIHGKPDRAGGPVMNMPSKLMEAGPCRRPSRGQGGKPDRAGGPMTYQIKRTWTTAPGGELCGGRSHEIDLPGWACKSTRDQPL